MLTDRWAEFAQDARDSGNETISLWRKTRMKRIIAILLAGVLALAAMTGCAPQAANGSDGRVIKIGVYEPATGEDGAGGRQETLGIRYANSVQPTVAIGGETYRVQLVLADNESSVEKGPTVAAALAEAGVSLVLGSYGSGVSLAASDVFERAGIPAIGITCTNPQITAGNQYYFRICFLDPFQGAVLANYAAETLGAKKAYCLAKLGNDYSAGLCSYFIGAFQSLGGEVVYETFSEGETDFTPYITAAVNEGAEVFFAPVSTEAGALLIAQAAEHGLDMPLLAGDTWDSNVITAAVRGTDLPVYVSTFFDEGTDREAGRSFVDGFKAWLNSDADAMADNGGNDMVSAASAMGYDAYFTALEAIKTAGSIEPAAIHAALWNTTYSGATGDIAFDGENGDAIRSEACIKQVDNASGAWRFVAMQKAD